MEKFKTTYTDISGWQFNIYQNTGGTRSKKIALHPDSNKEFFFKGSKELDTGEIRYPTEFWSEIVSSKIGQFLGFNMLDYNIGYNENDKQKIGCLSKSMVEHTENNLTEGKSYLTGYNPKYNPETDKKEYTFQFIRKALNSFRLEKYINNLIEVIIFDALISNSDRHQENWGVITFFRETLHDIENTLAKEDLKWAERFGLKFKRFIVKGTSFGKENRSKLMVQSDMAKHSFAPIYDSGCCLGREKEDHIVKQLLTDTRQLEGYINKGFSEIHWEGYEKKRRHFELVNLIKKEYPDKVKEILLRTENKFDREAISTIIRNVDNSLPEEMFNKYKLSDDRKELMIKIISLRFQKLMELK